MIRRKLPKPKYIAEGFHEDAANLLNEFMEKGSEEFSEFADIWKKHHFSLIYMGRPDEVELSEFTYEIFKVTSQFLASASFYEKVGAVYLLYALFRNQISKTLVKIRLEINHWRIIKTLLIEAKLKKYNTLHYVIDYLIKNAFVFVARQMLRGPLAGIQNVSKHQDTVNSLKTTYKSDIIEYSVSNNLPVLRDLHKQYLEEKKNFSDDFKINLTEASESYEHFIHNLQSLVEPSRNKKETLGSRRAKLKAQSFIRKTQDRFGNDAEERNESDHDVEYKTVEEVKKKVVRGKRVPKHERRVGRPRKNPKKIEAPETESDDDIDFSHLLSQQQELYLPPTEIECRKKSRKDPYYKVSPKRQEESSDPDDPTLIS